MGIPVEAGIPAEVEILAALQVGILVVQVGIPPVVGILVVQVGDILVQTENK